MPEFGRGSPGNAPEGCAKSFDLIGILDESFDFHRGAALGAKQRVDFKNELHAARPRLGWRASKQRTVDWFKIILDELLKSDFAPFCSASSGAVYAEESRGLLENTRNMAT